MNSVEVRHTKFAREVARTGNQTKAYKKVYRETDEKAAGAHASRLVGNGRVKKAISDILNEAGATREAGGVAIKDALKAEEVKTATDEGEITDEKFYVDHPTRIRAAELLYKLHGDLKQPGSSPDDPLYTEQRLMILPARKSQNGGKDKQNDEGDLTIDDSNLRKKRR